MALSMELINDWEWYCTTLCDRLLPINASYVTEDETVRMGHMVPDGEAAVRLKSGMAVRQIMIEYEVEDILLDDIN